MFLWTLGFLLFVVSQASTERLETIRPRSTAADTNPCARLSQTAAQFLSRNPNVTTVPLLPSEVYACQQDVPVNGTLVAEQISSLKSFVQFQTTLAYLKSPPGSYDLPPIDIIGALDNISSQALASQYKNEYEVEKAIYDLIAKAGDGHFRITPFLIGAFNFFTGVNLVSVSPDGLRVPSLYLQSDLELAAATSFTASPLVAIDNLDVETYVSQITLYSPLQTLDAKYNFLLYNPATTAMYDFSSEGAYFKTLPSLYHNDNTTYKFANGTSVIIQNKAIPKVDFTSDSGAALFAQYIEANGSNEIPTSANSSSRGLSRSEPKHLVRRQNSNVQLPGFPSSQIATKSEYLAGFFLNGTGLEDVAVLNIRSFDALGTDGAEFQSTVRQFLAESAEQNKKRLLIDVRGNGGGNLLLARDTFVQIYPTMRPYSALRYRLTDAANVLGSTLSNSTALALAANDDHSNLTQLETALLSQYRAENLIDLSSGQPYTTWEALATPTVSQGDNFTQITSWDFNNVTLGLALGLIPSGFANNTKLPPQVFGAGNITVLTDAVCSSTCADFIHLMIDQGNAKTIVAGGRPNNQPMAVIGGTQGGLEVPWSDLQQYAAAVLQIATETNSTTPEMSKELQPLIQGTPLNLHGGLANQHINMQDSFAQNDTSGIPLQFTKKYADCRMFYKAQDIFDVGYTWNRVVSGVAANGQGLCVNGTVSKWVAGGEPSSAPYQSGGGRTVFAHSYTLLLLVAAISALVV